MKLKHAWIAGVLTLCVNPLIQAAEVTTNVAVTRARPAWPKR